MKKGIISICLVFFLGLILITSLVSAINVIATPQSDVIIIDYNQPARFNLKISDIAPGTYSIYTLTDVKILPSNPVYLASGTNSMDVFIYALEGMTDRGVYNFNYQIGDHDERLKVKIVDFQDAIEVSSDAISIDSNKIKFYVRNLENAKIENIRAKFTTMLFETEQTFDLAPYEKKDVEVTVDPDKLKRMKPGPYVIQGEFETDKGPKIIEGKIYIGEKKGIRTEQDSSGFLIVTDTTTKINVGNVNEIVDVAARRNIISRLFTSFNVEPVSVDRKGLFVDYAWTQKLGPADVLVVKVKTNYVFPLLIIILAAFAIWGFRRIAQTKIEIKKSVSHVRTNGGEFALRVYLQVKAKTRVENVSLIDRIPGILKVHKQFGSVKPDKIDPENRRLQWYIGNLNPGEVRMFSYVVYSKMGIVGKFALPPAMAVLEKDSEIYQVESNRVFFLNEQIKREKD
ncbi:MAG: hypothetical protein WCP89_00910 [archaeon]